LKYQKYVPLAVVERFLDEKEKDLNQREMHEHSAAVAFVDISGFTKLSETLANQYKENGAEMLNTYISSYFDQLISTIFEYGGDIIKFAGDAMLVVWKSRKSFFKEEFDKRDASRPATMGRKKNLKLMLLGGEGNMDNVEPLYVHVLRCLACNLALMERHNNFKPMQGDDSICLTLHSGVGAGKLREIFVGGVENTWEYLVAGSPIKGMSDAGAEATAGEVFMDADSYALVKDWVTESKVFPSGNVKVSRLKDVPVYRKLTYPVFSRYMDESLVKFIPPLVRHRVEEADSKDLDGQYRRAYIMFVKLRGLDYDDPGVLEKLQKSVVEIQLSVNKYEGTIARLIADDKGTRFKIIFGLPRQVHEDNSARVVLTALEIQKRLETIETEAAIGIAHGNVFCGEAGSPQRSEYTAVGLKVNIAARIMSVADKKNIGILCDEKTFENASSHSFEWDVQEPTTLKGISQPVVLYKPLGKMKIADLFRRGGTSRQKAQTVSEHKSVESVFPQDKAYRMSIHLRRPSFVLKQQGLIGRQGELQKVRKLMDDVRVTKKSRLVLLEGTSGSGKSAFVLELMQDYEKSHPESSTFYSQAVWIERSSLFSVWKKIFQDSLDLGAKSVEDREKIVDMYLMDGYTIVKSVLNPILDTSYPETSFVSSMSPDGRTEYIRKLLVGICAKLAQHEAMNVVLENMNWADSASWGLAFDIASSVPNTFVLLSTRPFEKPFPMEYTNIRNQPFTTYLELRNLTKKEINQLVLRKLNCRVVPPNISDIVFAKSQGNPLHAEELVQSLVDQNFVAVNEGICTPQEKLFKEEFKSIPDSLKQIVATRLDNLSSKNQLTLKVCSVIGKDMIALDLLAAAHPMFDNGGINSKGEYDNSKMQALQVQLSELEKMSFVSKVQSVEAKGSETYSFTVIFSL
jgi:class 3 adenylate cyclase